MRTMTAVLLTASLALAKPTTEDPLKRLDLKVSVSVTDATLSDAIHQFHEATGLDFVVAEGGETVVTLFKVREMSARYALQLLLQPNHLNASFERGAVVIRYRRCSAGR